MKHQYLLIDNKLFMLLDNTFLKKEREKGKRERKNAFSLQEDIKFVKLSSPLAGNIRGKILNGIKSLVEAYNLL